MSEREAIRLLAAKLKFDAKIAAAEFQERIRLAEMTFGPFSPPPPPEKSPIDKALEDFVAKRKAKRGSNNGHDWPTESSLLFSQRKCRKCGLNGVDIRSADVCDGAKAVKRCDALGDAMRRLSFHEQDIHTRLMPYRREE